LEPKDLKIRVVENIDIAKDKVEKNYCTLNIDPKSFSSSKSNRGPLKNGWQESSNPIMCAYLKFNILLFFY